MTLAVVDRTRPGADAPDLALWAGELRHAAEIAQALASTPFVPDTLRVKDNHDVIDLEETAKVVAATLLAGREVGLEPMATLRSIYIVKGTPTMYAITQRALVLARGHNVWLVEANATRAIYRGRRKGENEVQESVWDMDRARALGIAGKPNWRAQPKVMLIARASSEICRLVAPEALLGLGYTVEELDDGADLPAAEPVAEPPPRKRTARRANPPAPQPSAQAATEPPVDEPETAAGAAGPDSATAPAVPGPDEPDPDDQVDYINPDQMRALQAGFTNLGIRDRARRLDITAKIIGRTVASANELYKTEASVVIDELARRRTELELQRAQAQQETDAAAALDQAYEQDMRRLEKEDTRGPLDQ